MADGCDIAYGLAAILLKEDDYPVKLHCVLPCKNYNSSNTWWWLRSANSNGSSSFRDVDYGDLNNNDASKTYGVAPAFRIG